MIANANALALPFADGIAQTIVTSPPYYGLRDYGVAGQIGLEQTPAEYVAQIVAVMRECWRVLRDDGTLWLNLGDSYVSGKIGRHDSVQANNGREWSGTRKATERQQARINSGVKQKDLLGIPWRVAFALQDDGWYLRSDIIWAKPNPMPESVTDRPTKAHEYVFLLSKQPRYFWDAEAVKEQSVGEAPISRMKIHDGLKQARMQSLAKTTLGTPADATRNTRSVWTISTRPYSGAHFATMPPELARRCILAGTSERGQCPNCGKAWERTIEKFGQTKRQAMYKRGQSSYASANGNALNYSGGHDLPERQFVTTGFRPGCACPPHDPIPQIVLDPFAGAGTTGKVAIENRRRFIGTELNPTYIRLAEERTSVLPVALFD